MTRLLRQERYSVGTENATATPIVAIPCRKYGLTGANVTALKLIVILPVAFPLGPFDKRTV